MSVTSFHFFCAFAVSLAVYYTVPKKCQWQAIFLFSIYFFVQSSGWKTGIFFLADAAATAYAAVWTGKAKTEGNAKAARRFLVLGLSVDIAVLAVLKYSPFFVYNWNLLVRLAGRGPLLEPLSLNAPIGISFYTLISIGYLADVYWGLAEAEKNPFKTALLIGYYPHMTSGPVSRFGQLHGKLFGGGYFYSYDTVAGGLQRMLWGVFKKLVVSERARILVDAVYGNQDAYRGFYIWTAAFLFMLQLYTDFSGCMDIILGASECYGIRLPENFRTPFFSGSVQEFWQRWHITLGAWLKDYVLYPLMRTGVWHRMTKWLKKHAGKKASRQVPSYLGMLCVWLLIGLWHGGAWKYILGMGLWFWLCITLEKVLEPFFCRLTKLAGIRTDNFGWHLFQSLRVFLLVSFGNMFFRLGGISSTLSAVRNGFAEFNPWIFFDGSFVQMGLSYRDQNILVIGIFLLFLAAFFKEVSGGARIWIRKQFFAFRWAVWLFLFVSVLAEGIYGPGYSAAEFIYRGF